MEKYEATRNDNDSNAQYEADKQKSTEKAVDLAGEVALDYFTGGQGSAIKNELEKVPVVGEVVKDTWDGAVKDVSKIVSKTPAGDALKSLDDSGITDMAKQAKGFINISKGGSSVSGATPSGTTPSGATPTGTTPSGLNPPGSAPSSKGVGSQQNGVEDQPSVKTSDGSLSQNDLQEKLTSDSSSLEENASNGEKVSSKDKSLLQDIGKKLFFMNFKSQIIVMIIVLFGFTLFFTIIASAKDFANLNLTNNSTMSQNSSVGTGSIDSSSLSGGTAQGLALGQSLLSVLGQEKINLWNDKIKTDVSKASSTSDAVAVAAYDLIQGALNEGIVLPYFWGGGHGAIYEGIDPSIGSNKKIGASGSNLQPIGSNQPYGYDCSGFVSWAIKNGGCSNFNALSTAGFRALPGKVNINVSKAKRGDVAVSNSHIVLILSNSGKSLQVAEAKGAKVGIVFNEYDYSYFSKYEVIDMSVYYATYC